LAYVVGTWLITIIALTLALQIGAPKPPAVVRVGWTVHGFLFIGYFLTVLELAYRNRWSLARTAVVAVAGTIPFCSMVAERRVTRQLAAV
jgi:integral membrane protein